MQLGSIVNPQDQQQVLTKHLCDAGLLTEAQVGVIHADQATTAMSFSEIVIHRGWLKAQTIDYFMQKLFVPDRNANEKDMHLRELEILRGQKDTLQLIRDALKREKETLREEIETLRQVRDALRQENTLNQDKETLSQNRNTLNQDRDIETCSETIKSSPQPQPRFKKTPDYSKDSIQWAG